MITELNGDLSGIEISNDFGTLRVLDQGAQVVHWQPAGHRPVLFASSKAEHSPGRHVRAGAPIVFPWFGFGQHGDRRPVHGYARLRRFHREGVEEEPTSVTVRHSLRPSLPDDLPARLDVRTTMGLDSLEIALSATNTSATNITYEIGLHTYLECGDITLASIEGLEGQYYIDRSASGATATPQIDALRVQGEVDRAYRHTGFAQLVDPTWQRVVRVDKTGSATTIIWNPWIENTAAMPDFGNDEWRSTVCIEAANAGDAGITLEPGQHHAMSQRIAPIAI